MSKIRVLHLTSTRYGIGGVERLLLDMSDKYDSQRFEIVYCNLFCDSDGNGVFPAELRAKGLEYIDIRGRQAADIPAMILALRRALARERIDVVHLHMLQATIVGGAAVLGSNVRTVLTRHYTDNLSDKGFAIQAAELFFTKRASRIAAISEFVKQDLIGLGVDPSKITHVPNGTDLAEFDRKLSRSLPRAIAKTNNEIIISSVGSLTPRKGHKFLVEAMPAILKRFPNARLLIAGEGPEKDSLLMLKADLDLDERVSFLGFVEDVVPLLDSTDIYVHPSIHEPFGIAILEAMAAKKCVVATRVDGIPEIVIDGDTGVLVSAADAGELQRVLHQLLGDLTVAVQMGKNGRRRVEEAFDIRRTVEANQELYMSVLPGPTNDEPGL